MRTNLASLMAVAFGVLLLGCSPTSNTANGQVTVGIAGITNGTRLTAPRAVTITTSSTGGHITRLVCMIDGTSVLDKAFDNSSVTQTLTIPAGVLDMGNHTFTATATDAGSNSNSASVTYTVAP